ncbi:protein kinase family protein [Streptomyces gobiensis]|uniref:protein kinase family protein n=1 Tax=Streptomyces gobiensis TaxID=2875706 RepID=UPI001E351AFC|nr:protein kinase family protein [Streptomyces gobiensis]UGY92547.1 protein kinase family protein [Streptomyces gobiensis]
MAERSTAAVDVADTSGENSGDDKPLTARADETTADGTTPQQSNSAPELHSGHKLARRYRLEECVTRLDGFSSWRAMDEKLRRAVGVHLLPADHPRARPVLAAARSAALLGDPRFVQVLDAVEEDDLVYVVHEWLPDATPLTTLFASGPLEPHEAYQLVSQVSQAMAAAHREGLAHLRLTPSSVLRTGTGQYRIRGLAVNAALRGISSDHPQRTDTEAVGALLYASLTQRWPYEQDAYGLSGIGGLSGDSLLSPDQIRAGVHRALSQLAMRALVNDGATASSEDQPCATPEELVKAVAELPRIRPPEPTFSQPPPYQRAPHRHNGYQHGSYGPEAARTPAGPARSTTVPPASPPPTLPGRTGKVIKWGVSALLIAALGLASWQIAGALMNGDGSDGSSETSKQSQGHSPRPATPTGKPVEIVSARILDSGSERGDTAPAYDGNPDTYWQTFKYASAKFGNLKPGVGLILDLGEVKQVSSIKVSFKGQTAVDFLAAPQTTGSMPVSHSGFSKVSSGTGSEVTLKAKKPIKTRYVLVWVTELPLTEQGEYRARVTEIDVSS